MEFKLIKKTFFVLLISLVGFINAAFAGYVSDDANVINNETKTRLTVLTTELEQKTGAEIAVVTVSALGNEPIETYALNLFKKIGIGKKDKNNGVLLLMSVSDRKVRIETGYGLESVLPDGLCGSIIDRYVIPSFKQGDYNNGLYMGTLAIASVIAADAGAELTGAIDVNSAWAKNPASVFFMILLGIIVLLIFIRHPFLFFFLMTQNGWHTGRFGNGRGFGSGGFGGFGGGMSGGGGASRSW
jgi:uncharacterized protein